MALILRRKHLIGISVDRHLHRLPWRQLALLCSSREKFTSKEVVSTRLATVSAGVQVLARMHAADAHLAGEGSADGFLRDQRLGLAHFAQRRIAHGQGAVQLLLRGRLACTSSTVRW